MAKTSLSSPRSILETPIVSVITVCVAENVVEQVALAVNDMPWAPVHERFSRYLGQTSRAHWSTHTKNAKTCIALVDFDGEPAAALETVEFLHETLPGKVSVVALSSDKNPEMILRTMRAGCSEYLDNPFNADQFSAALTRLDKRYASAVASPQDQGKIFAFFGAKGGVGTTTLAVHLAVQLAHCHQKKTLLIDNHSELGHVCLYLGIEGEHYSFHELLRSVNRLDVDLLKGFVVKHSSGLDVIASAESHGGSRNTDPQALEQTLEFLRDEYDYVLLDCSTSLEEANMTVVERSDQVYLVATPDIGAVRDLSRHVDGLIRYQQPTEKLRLIVNRSGSKGAMTAAQIEKAVRLPLSISIPNSYAELAKAANTGVPVAANDKSEFSTHLQVWGREVAGAPIVKEQIAKKSFAFWK